MAALAEISRRLHEGEIIDAALVDALGFECRNATSIFRVLGSAPCTAIAAITMRVRFEADVACPLFRQTPKLGGEGCPTSLRLLELLSLQALEALGLSVRIEDRAGFPALRRLLSCEHDDPQHSTSGHKRPRMAVSDDSAASIASTSLRAARCPGHELRSFIRALLDPTTGTETPAALVIRSADARYFLSDSQRSVYDAVVVSLQLVLTPGISALAAKHHLATQCASTEAQPAMLKYGLPSLPLVSTARNIHGYPILHRADVEHVKDVIFCGQAS